MIIDQILQEAQNYEGMFNDILKLNADPRLRQQITQDIDWARKILRKNDRIVWFLRWVKVWLISTATGSGVAAAASPGALQRQDPRLGAAPGQDDLMGSPALKQQLEHFMSLPVPEIQNYVFKAESPRGLFDLFAKYEAAWRQQIEEERSLHHTGGRGRDPDLISRRVRVVAAAAWRVPRRSRGHGSLRQRAVTAAR